MGNYKKIVFGLQNLGSAVNNFLSTKKLAYIIEKGWVIEWDGKQITNSLNKQKLISARTTSLDIFLQNKIVHYGSINTFLDENGIKNKKIKQKNKVVVTWFHVPPDDVRVEHILLLNKYADIVHTSCNLTREKLIKHGLKKEKIVVIPLGVDLSIFKPKIKAERGKIKKKLNIPNDKVIIGSFQKDGEGWGEGLKPKLVKGPDIFLKVVQNISKKFPVFVLLTGPARGYVKNGLEKMGVPYRHDYLQNYYDIVDYYNALDLYLVTSREEGGPKAILESMACGVPLVTTKVGMAPDILTDQENAMLVEKENIDGLIKSVATILKNKKLKTQITTKALNDVVKYKWDVIVKQYYQQIYKQLL